MNLSSRSSIVVCLLLSMSIQARINPTKEQCRRISEICSYRGPRTFLLSYPQSGNTWFRYCLEFLTSRPTLHRTKTEYRSYQLHYIHPLAWQAGFEIDEHKPLIEKIHQAQGSLLCHNGEKTYHNRDTDTLIFILRNPKECIARTQYASFSELLDTLWGNAYQHRLYFENLALFDEWPTERRYLVYYEDLITKPRETLAGILAFLDESDERLDQFMDQYQHHKEKCLSLYSGATSRGSDPLFHSKKLSAQYRKQVDLWIADAYPELWEKYLQRYHESD
jgi:hypothetical protein